MMGSATLTQYVAVKRGQGWVVFEQNVSVPLYDCDPNDDPLSEQEAKDLAWAWTSGAEDDTEAVRMIIKRDGKRPVWLPVEYASGFMKVLEEKS